MKKRFKLFFLCSIFTALLAGCDAFGTNEHTPEGGNKENDAIKKQEQIIGRGYNVTSRYAESSDIKAAVLNFKSLYDDGKIKLDSNKNTSSMETVTGSTIAEYQKNLEINAKVQVLKE